MNTTITDIMKVAWSLKKFQFTRVELTAFINIYFESIQAA